MNAPVPPLLRGGLGGIEEQVGNARNVEGRQQISNFKTEKKIEGDWLEFQNYSNNPPDRWGQMLFCQ